jgi:hypothetical protein
MVIDGLLDAGETREALLALIRAARQS